MFRGSDNFVKAFLFGCYGNQASFLKTFHHILLYLFFFVFPSRPSIKNSSQFSRILAKYKLTTPIYHFNDKPKAHLIEKTLLWKPYLSDYVCIDTDRE